MLTEKGFSFTNFLSELGHYQFGNVDEFGLFVDSGGEQTFELLAESTSYVSSSFLVSSTTEPVAESSSDMSILATLDLLTVGSILAESTSKLSIIPLILPSFRISAESLSDALTDLATQDTGYTSFLAESLSEIEASGMFNSTTTVSAESLSDALTTITASFGIVISVESSSESTVSISVQDIGYIASLIVESSSEFIINPLFNITFSLLATSESHTNSFLATLVSTTSPVVSSTSLFNIEITPDLIGYLGLFPCTSTSFASANAATSSYIFSEPLTEEGLSVSNDLTEFGFNIINPFSDHSLTVSGKHVFYTTYNGLNIKIISESLAKIKIRHQYFQDPYIIIFDSNYNLVSVEDINSGKFIEVKDNNKFTLDIDT